MGGVCSCRGLGSQVNAGSILDRVISQASDEDQCLLYRLANYKKSGELIDAYNQGGQAEVEKLIREQFGVLMYADGKGQMINRAEYLRWKFRDLEQVVLPIEASLSRFDPLAQWNDHQACWQMQYRGSLGETLLHVLIICDTRLHTRLARILLKCFPRLAIDVVEGEEYLGASALHLAIAYNNNELVQDLVEVGAIISQRAIGSFFLPRDQQRMNPAKNTDYEGLAYLGEYPLAWAACCANESVYNLLLDSGADPDEQDSFGNMILHMVVVCDKLDMFGYALRHPKLPARNGIVNAAGLTPLTLACQLGRAEVFREMLELSAREFWRYSNITCSAYPLNALDTLLPDGRTNWNSALFIILNGTKEEHLNMLDGGIIQRLLEEKWKTFARFLKRLIILVFHLTSLSLAVYLRPSNLDTVLLKWPEEVTEVGRTIAECITVLGVLSYILVQLGGEIINIGVLSFLKQLSHEPAKLIFLISNLLILACIPCRLAGNRHAEDAILVVAVPGSWFLLMFFAGAIRLTGPFVTMVYSMITGDMLTFGIIYMVVLFGFCQSFYFLYKGFPGVKSSLYSSYHSTWMALFQVTLGDYNYTDLSYTTYPNLSKMVFTIFMVLVPILLLNMLIAMMGNTYAHVIEQSEKEWVKQWAKIVVSLERAVSQKDAQNYLQEYSIKLGPGDDPNNPASEQRGVLVIKSKSKTKAKQRKGAVANWKRVGKVTINELRKRGMTGEELRRIMWGRASFSTPVRVSPNVDEPQVSAVTAGFGDALTAALDVMAFAHDLDLSTATESIPTNIDVKQSKPKVVSSEQTKLTTNNQEKPSITEKAATEIANKQVNAKDETNKKPNEVVDVEKMNVKNANNSSTVEEYHDLFLEFVIASESMNDPETLLKMAERVAAEFDSSANPKINLQILEQFTMTKIPMEEQAAAVKKQYFIESSDNDFGGDNLLGTVARLRRIRSANSRFITARRHSRHVNDDMSSTSSASGDGNPRYQQLLNDTEEVPSNQRTENRDESIVANKSEVKQNDANCGSRCKAQKRRPKTARNRVSPKETEDSGQRRRESMERNKAVSPATSPTDPLEPWSTRGIKDMNTILAWEENVPDSP
ncbi:transient receptor potential cation channel subfamily V iav isoform X2 [Megachile rotundata]|uniref:transient receptor potential cation channel subfamily V iav isoform X2 n=1 Tax=Megachile rotundata TaxID=143995 RepID=UPI003FD58E82